MTEFDYRKEAENLKQVADNLAPTWHRKVVVPLPYLDLCSKQVCVGCGPF